MALSEDNKRNPASSPPFAFCYSIRMCLWRIIKWAPVLLIMSVVGWSYYAYVYELCYWTIDSILQQVIYLLVYHLVLVMFMWSYWQTIFAEIKTVPEMFRLPERELEKLLSCDSEEQQREHLENFAKELPITTRTNSGSVRYCNRCVLIKPDRAHHCSICAKCVLKMDHHCPWVNNCVCYFNYKFFMLFLGYALLYCLFIICTSLPLFIKFWQHQLGEVAGPGQYHIVFLFFIALMFSISLGPLFGYHCYLVARNRTTLDMLIKFNKYGGPTGPINKMILSLYNEAFRAPMFRGGADKNGFSIGHFNNFKEVFGNTPKLWLFPIFSSLGDGCQYPVRNEHQLRTYDLPPEAHSYESMGTTRPSFGDGIVYPERQTSEDSESLLSSEQWDRWGQRPKPFDEHVESSSYDEL